MEPVVSITIKLDDIEFTLNADQAEGLYKILGHLLGVKKNDFLELKELLENNASRPYIEKKLYKKDFLYRPIKRTAKLERSLL